MTTYLDAIPLVGLGSVGRLDLLSALPGPLSVPLSVREQVTTEPAAANLRRQLERGAVRTDIPGDGAFDEDARSMLGEPATTADVRLIAGVLERAEAGVTVVSDDRRVRTLAAGLGATVTGTVGVLVSAVDDGLPPGDARDILRDLDRHGLHATGRYLETADALIEAAASPGESACSRAGAPPGRRRP